MAVLDTKYPKLKKTLINLFVFSLVFSDILGNGNLNLIYFFGIILVISNSKLKILLFKDIIIFFSPFCLLVVIEILFSGNLFIPKKVLVYTLKILVCSILMSYTKNLFWYINIRAIIKKVSYVYGIMLLISFFTMNVPVLWRLNDEYNNFSKTRLKFLYSEPSVLGILCGLMLIILIHYIFNKKLNRKEISEVILFTLILILTFSMSGIVYTVVGAGVLYIFECLKYRKQIPQGLLLSFVAGICIIIFVLATDNPISNRFFSMFLGLDGSYNFRWTAAVNTYNKVMKMTNNWGMGVGNMNTVSGLSMLRKLGIDYKFANSFLYFLTENGFLGIIYIGYLFLICLYCCFKSSRNIRPLKVGLLFFVFISQIAGGYFTDPILWMVYGIICSKEPKGQQIINEGGTYQ